MNCPHSEEELTFIDDKYDLFYECENLDCSYLMDEGEPFTRAWTDEDEALEKADHALDMQKDGDL